jgi:hypothetical protein
LLASAPGGAVSFTPQTVYTHRKSLFYSLYERLGGSHSWRAHMEYRNIPCCCRGSNPDRPPVGPFYTDSCDFRAHKVYLWYIHAFFDPLALPGFLRSSGSWNGFPLSLVSTIEELLGRKSSGSCLESREYGSMNPSR